MVDPHGMTIFNGIQNLQESMFGKRVVSNEMASFGDVGEQVALGTELNYNKGTVRTVQYPY
jgi:hypothetical protein